MCIDFKFRYGLVLSLALIMCAGTGLRAQNWEQRVLEDLSRHRTAGTTHFMQGVSNSTACISLAVPVTVFVAGAIRHDAGAEVKGVEIAGAIVLSTGIELALKYTVNRARPSTRDSLIIPETDIGSPSFPSGHTSQAFATAMALSIAYPKWYVIAPSFLWAGTVGFSRLYLGAHYPTDVLAGAVVGAGSAWLAHKLNQWLFAGRLPGGRHL